MTRKSPDTAARVALFPGSFNPFTRGHASIASRALDLFDRLVICVGFNADKGDEAADRADAIAASIARLYADEPRVTVVADPGLSVDIARRHGARFIVRGIRSGADLDYERPMADVNRDLAGIETVFLLALPELASVSSSMVRELERYGVDTSRYLP